MINLNNPEISFCLEAVRQASLLVRQIQSDLVTPSLTKNDRSPVTVADFASQALVGMLLGENFPEDAMVAEEDSTALKQPELQDTLQSITQFLQNYLRKQDPSELVSVEADSVCKWIDTNRADTGTRFWTLDPIDGTKGFLRGDQYVVAMALVVQGKVQIGALGCPNLSVDQQHKGSPALQNGNGSLVIAARNQGSWITNLSQPGTFSRLFVSNTGTPSQTRLLRSFESGHTDSQKIDQFSAVMDIQEAPVLMDSQVKYVILASGRAELLLRLLSPSRPDYREKIWDQAAGSLILEEAGGRITDLSGKDLDFSTGRQLINNRGVLASNSKLHSAALRAIAQIDA